ncbi:hypothetical protein EYD45_04165 [Hyunsoonleella flava]|uniref:Uncharacterized protein n=1 Tax=Hyunsoonleella flava TaxID=2527939 RepID=A0A4Q9FGV8_9FLAO|nr:hypothetical protein [Hyunsoonleella flava]TBN05479.1 hypothetical protein EYD45_04165 [Hyunsoonleella flava]
MGGEGSMAGANVSLKNNRNQLSKRKHRKALGGSYADIELKEFPKASEKQLKEIKEKIQKENRRARLWQLMVFMLLIIIIGLLIFNL